VYVRAHDTVTSLRHLRATLWLGGCGGPGGDRVGYWGGVVRNVATVVATCKLIMTDDR